MYKFTTSLKIEEYNHFYEQYSKAPIMQDKAWAQVKDNFDATICGLYRDDTLVAAALILIKKLPLNFKLFYIPRGYLIDWTDKELLSIFTKNIKAYAKKERAYCIKIDPYISLTEQRVNPLDKENYTFYSENHKTIMDNLKSLGYHHRGFKKEIGAYVQPRFTMVVPLIDDKGSFLNEEFILKSLKKNVRSYLGDYQTKRGVLFSYSTDKNDLDEFIKIINFTEQRKNISLRNKHYYEKIMDAFGERAILFFAKLDIDQYLNFLESSKNDKDFDSTFLSEQRELALNLKKERGSIITVSAAIVVLPANKEGIKMAEFLYAGNDVSIFPNLKINNGLTFYRLIYCLNHQYHYANLGGVDGSLTDNLAVFKSKFNPLVLEFIGEYDLPINKLWYKMINYLEPLAKKLYHKISR